MEHVSIYPGVFAAVDQLFVPFIARLFFVFGIIGFAVGVGLILNHGRMYRIFGFMNHWVSTRNSTKWLAVPRDMGSAVQRFRKPIGAAFVLIAAYSTVILITQVDIDRFVAALGVAAPHAFVAWIVGCVRLFMILGGIAAIAVGLMLIYSPHTLLAIEKHANHWYSFRRCALCLDTMHMGLDRWVESSPRAAGWLIALPALFVVVDYGLLLFSNG